MKIREFNKQWWDVRDKINHLKAGEELHITVPVVLRPYMQLMFPMCKVLSAENNQTMWVISRKVDDVRNWSRDLQVMFIHKLEDGTLVPAMKLTVDVVPHIEKLYPFIKLQLIEQTEAYEDIYQVIPKEPSFSYATSLYGTPVCEIVEKLYRTLKKRKAFDTRLLLTHCVENALQIKVDLLKRSSNTIIISPDFTYRVVPVYEEPDPRSALDVVIKF